MFFPLQNAVCFIILTYFVPLLFTFHIQGVLNLKKIYNCGAESLTLEYVCMSWNYLILSFLHSSVLAKQTFFPLLFTFYIQDVLKFKINSGAKRLSLVHVCMSWNYLILSFIHSSALSKQTFFLYYLHFIYRVS